MCRWTLQVAMAWRWDLERKDLQDKSKWLTCGTNVWCLCLSTKCWYKFCVHGQCYINSLPHSFTGNIKCCITSMSFYVLLISIPPGSLTFWSVCHYWWKRIFSFLLKLFCFSSVVSIATHTGSDESLILLQTFHSRVLPGTTADPALWGCWGTRSHTGSPEQWEVSFHTWQVSSSKWCGWFLVTLTSPFILNTVMRALPWKVFCLKCLFWMCLCTHVFLHICNYFHKYEFAAPSWKLVLVANSLWKRLSRIWPGDKGIFSVISPCFNLFVLSKRHLKKSVIYNTDYLCCRLQIRTNNLMSCSNKNDFIT